MESGTHYESCISHPVTNTSPNRYHTGDALKRRTFLTNTADAAFNPREPERSTDGKPSKFANKELPKVERSLAGIEPYTGTWGFDQIAHLVRRTIFGASRADVQVVTALTMDDIVELLLIDVPLPSPPLNPSSSDASTPVGQTWINALTSDYNNSRHSSLKSWWVGLMLGQGISLREKMTLFWHNHFVSEATVIGDARLTYRQNDFLRQHALSNFKTMTKLVTLDPAMLKYLNGNTNTKTNPNENYARELQELFSVGKGPEIAPGNYTNYTEADVQAAAKVLTGWRNNGVTLTSYFTLSRHDTTNKQFSSAYQNTVITGNIDGSAEIDDLLNVIFAQPETARYICRKLYRWFVYYVIDPTTETNVIEPLANVFRTNNYDIKPVLRALFKSAHFYDMVNMGCIIKNPIDYAVGLMRVLGVQFPNSSNVTRQYNHWKYVREQAGFMQLDLCEPPNVAGWPAYYQAPQFHELWINSDTLQKRSKLSTAMMTTGYTSNGYKIIVDPIWFANQVSNPADPNILIGEFAQYLFPIDITVNQKAFLMETLIPGLPEYEWTKEWLIYQSDPTDPAKLNAVQSKLQALLSFMLSMAEYQLM